MYYHPAHEAVLRAIQAKLPQISPNVTNKIVQAKGRYRNAQDWLSTWPKLCAETINGGLFFLLDDDGFIGKGVHTEITDVLKKVLPVYLMTRDGNCYPITTLQGDAFVEGPDWKLYTFVDIKKLTAYSANTHPKGE